MGSLIARVVKLEDVGFIESCGCSSMDSDPDRTNVTFDAVNCSLKHFLQALLNSEEGHCFIGISQSDVLCILLSPSFSMTEGSIIEVDPNGFVTSKKENRQ